MINLLRKRYEHSKNKDKEYEKRKKLGFGTKYEVYKSDLSLKSIFDINKLREAEKVSDLEKWIDSIRDPKNKAISRLQFHEPEITLRQIAKRLSLSKSDVGRQIQKLKKNKPSF